MPRILALVAAMLGAVSSPAAEPASSLFFRDGDRVVVIGDSITVQGDYGRYVENYIRTRYPRWNFMLRNAGINGHTAQMGLPYIDADVLVWKPTVAIVNWGMNDGRRSDGTEYYKSGIVPYVDRLLAHQVRVVLCSNSPLDIGDEPGKFTGFNQNFHAMADFARRLAEERNLTFVDQFHFCHRVWGENRNLASPVPVTEQTLAQHTADSVHARSPGQLTMAFVILKTLGAPGEVSHATVDAATGRISTRRCEISQFRNQDGVIAFVRSDEGSPCFIDDRGALAFELVPFQQELNRMTLEVRGLAEGTYELQIDDFVWGQLTARQLGQGVNLSTNRLSPLYGPGRKVGQLARSQQAATYRARQVTFFKPPDWLKIPDLDQQKASEFSRARERLEQADAAIAAAPQPHTYEIRRITP